MSTLTAERAPADPLVATARECAQRGWLPATSGNLSVRANDRQMLITPSGADKGALEAADLVLVDIHTLAVTGPGRPSAETAVHAAVYRTTGARAVVHAHPLHATALSALVPARRTQVRWSDWELLKVLTGGAAAPVDVPVLPNHEDVGRIAAEAEALLRGSGEHPPVLLIAGHGVTVWADSLATAFTRLECVEAVSALHLLADRRQTLRSILRSTLRPTWKGLLP